MSDYAFGQLAKAFVTAVSGDDAELRERADRRVRQWNDVITGIATGRVTLGSRTPVSSYPEWVTLEVIRGGFTTGRARAEGPLDEDEVELARKLRLPATRPALFAHYLTDDGLNELWRMLDAGTYRIDVPEDGALLAVAWLLREGDRAAAFDVLEAIGPFAGRLRFAPKPARKPSGRPELVFRWTAHQGVERLRSRQPNERVEIQRETLTVWNPFADRVLSHWLRVYSDGRIVLETADDQWFTDSRALIDEYDYLAELHTRSTKHRKPKENLAIWLRMLRNICLGEQLDPRELGLLRAAIDGAVTKRGLPGSDRHSALRLSQHEVAAAPAFRRLSVVAAERIADLDPESGIERVENYARPVSPHEAETAGIRVGTAMPPPVIKVLARTEAADIDVLVEHGGVPSAEVLAELVETVTAAVVADSFDDTAVARLAGTTYRAFGRRRSLLLTNLASQVRYEELPWAAALQAHAAQGTSLARQVFAEVGRLYVDHFATAITPNQLVTQLEFLAKSAGIDAVFLKELAADIFMGDFSPPFVEAALVASQICNPEGIYVRYYGIDVDDVRKLSAASTERKSRRRFGRPKDEVLTLAELCQRRAGVAAAFGQSAANGAVIEQAQVITTHNLAALVASGVEPGTEWIDLARTCLQRSLELVDQARRQTRGYSTIKDAAYAWRQGVFFLDRAELSQVEVLLEDRTLTALAPAGAEILMERLRAAARPGTAAPDGRPFYGWSVGRHWLLDAPEPQH